MSLFLIRQRSMGEASQEDTTGNTGASGGNAHGQQREGGNDAVKFGVGQQAPSDGESTSNSSPENDDLDCIPPL